MSLLYENHSFIVTQKKEPLHELSKKYKHFSVKTDPISLYFLSTDSNLFSYLEPYSFFFETKTQMTFIFETQRNTSL